MKAGKTVAVLGAGTMGAGIAAQYALYGSEVMLYSRTEETLERARKTIENACALLGETGAVTPEMAAAAPGRVNYTTDVATAVEHAWYVVETIAERADAKTALYEQLDALLGEDVILASNTSYMDIFKLIPPHRASHTLIAHWFAPAHILPLVEVVKGEGTSDEVVEQVMEFHRACGKTPICMERYVPGFIINRLQSAMTREVMYLLENGYCTGEDIDLAVKTSLMPRGVLLGLVERMDFSGLDTVANGLRNKSYTPAPAPGEDNPIFGHVERGELGVKSGSGFYDYSHRPYAETLRKRDEQLVKSVALAKECIGDPLHKA